MPTNEINFMLNCFLQHEMFHQSLLEDEAQISLVRKFYMREFFAGGLQSTRLRYKINTFYLQPSPYPLPKGRGEMTYRFLTSLMIFSTAARPSSKNMTVFSFSNKGFLIPANPGLRLRLITIMLRALSTFKIGIP